MNDKPKLLKISEAAEMLGVNAETLRRWDNEGKLQAVRIGYGTRKHRRYKMEDIQKIIESTNKP